MGGGRGEKGGHTYVRALLTYDMRMLDLHMTHALLTYDAR